MSSNMIQIIPWDPPGPMLDEARFWEAPDTNELGEEWLQLRQRISEHPGQERFLQAWLKERARAFAIETGQIEGLYTLKPGVTEQLIAEGFAAVAGTDAYESLDDDELRGLLEDQELAYHMMREDTEPNSELRLFNVKEWHGLLTRHQSTVAGVTHGGRRVQIPFERKGTWKRKANITTLPDGSTLEYCPPEQVQSEMERLIDMYAEVEQQKHPAHVEAAWLHHRFVRIHPFEDGNKRTGRLLMARCFLKRGLPPPVLSAADRENYFRNLARAHLGDLKSLSDYLEDFARSTLRSAVSLARDVIKGRLHRPNGNGGRTVGDTYVPPNSDAEVKPNLMDIVYQDKRRTVLASSLSAALQKAGFTVDARFFGKANLRSHLEGDAEEVWEFLMQNCDEQEGEPIAKLQSKGGNKWDVVGQDGLIYFSKFSYTRGY